MINMCHPEPDIILTSQSVGHAEREALDNERQKEIHQRETMKKKVWKIKLTKA